MECGRQIDVPYNGFFVAFKNGLYPCFHYFLIDAVNVKSLLNIKDYTFEAKKISAENSVYSPVKYCASIGIF